MIWPAILSVYDAYDGTVYIDNRPYQVVGILSEMGTVASGISPDEAIFIPYNTGLKYLASNDVSPTMTVIAEDVNDVENVITNIEAVLAESYPNAELLYLIQEAGWKKRNPASNDTLTMLLICMAVIVFIVGGLGIMNVLFVSVKERTNEIGILKALDQKGYFGGIPSGSQLYEPGWRYPGSYARIRDYANSGVFWRYDIPVCLGRIAVPRIRRDDRNCIWVLPGILGIQSDSSCSAES